MSFHDVIEVEETLKENRMTEIFNREEWKKLDPREPQKDGIEFRYVCVNDGVLFGRASHDLVNLFQSFEDRIKRLENRPIAKEDKKENPDWLKDAFDTYIKDVLTNPATVPLSNINLSVDDFLNKINRYKESIDSIVYTVLEKFKKEIEPTDQHAKDIKELQDVLFNRTKHFEEILAEHKKNILILEENIRKIADESVTTKKFNGLIDTIQNGVMEGCDMAESYKEEMDDRQESLYRKIMEIRQHLSLTSSFKITSEDLRFNAEKSMPTSSFNSAEIIKKAEQKIKDELVKQGQQASTKQELPGNLCKRKFTPAEEDHICYVIGAWYLKWKHRDLNSKIGVAKEELKEMICNTPIGKLV